MVRCFLHHRVALGYWEWSSAAALGTHSEEAKEWKKMGCVLMQEGWINKMKGKHRQ